VGPVQEAYEREEERVERVPDRLHDRLERFWLEGFRLEGFRPDQPLEGLQGDTRPDDVEGGGNGS
jgi:hypothetical protein